MWENHKVVFNAEKIGLENGVVNLTGVTIEGNASAVVEVIRALAQLVAEGREACES